MENYQWTFTGCLGQQKDNNCEYTAVVFVKTTGDSTTLGKDVLCCRVQENLKSYYRENSKSQVDLAPDSQQSHTAYLM